MIRLFFLFIMFFYSVFASAGELVEHKHWKKIPLTYADFDGYLLLEKPKGIGFGLCLSHGTYAIVDEAGKLVLEEKGHFYAVKEKQNLNCEDLNPKLFFEFIGDIDLCGKDILEVYNFVGSIFANRVELAKYILDPNELAQALEFTMEDISGMSCDVVDGLAIFTVGIESEKNELGYSLKIKKEGNLGLVSFTSSVK